MPTQKTGKRINSNEIDLGEPGEEVNIGGRELKRLSSTDQMRGMQDVAFQQTPINPEFAQSSKEEVDRMLPEFMKEQKEKEQTATNPEVNNDIRGILADRYVKARREGNVDLAEALKGIIGDVVDDPKPKRIRAAKQEHPALQKLRRNLGLSKIRPVTIPWAGSDWLFYPAPPALDHWAIQMTDSGVGNYAAMKIAAACVGLDGAPLYEVFNITVTAEFESPVQEKPVTVAVFEKTCDSCGAIVTVEAETCGDCSSLLDPFDMPLPLRAQCAERLNRFFMEEFGPYEELPDLYEKMRKEMPDRVTDKGELYGPFLKSSSEDTETTPTSPSGDKP